MSARGRRRPRPRDDDDGDADDSEPPDPPEPPPARRTGRVKASRQPEVNSNAKLSMQLAIGGVLCGFLAPVAAFLALKARSEIAASPGRYRNESHALVGLGLGGLMCVVYGVATIRVFQEQQPNRQPAITRGPDPRPEPMVPAEPSPQTPQPAAVVPGGHDDDDDIRARCKALQKWDGVGILKCSGEPGHAGISIVLTDVAWDFLGKQGRREAFARAALESFKGHWSGFHRWTGEDPAKHQVVLWMIDGSNPQRPVMGISASGFTLQ